MNMKDKYFKDAHFEECLVQALIVDRNFAEQMVEVLDVKYFSTDSLREITKMMFEYYHKYKAFPSYKLLVTMIKNEFTDGALKQQIAESLLKIKKEPLYSDMEYVKEAALDYCKKKALFAAMTNSLSLIEDKKYEHVLSEMKDAILRGSDRSIGHEYNDGFTQRMTKEAIENILPTPWPKVSSIMRGGGLSGGKVGCVAAATGVGKSHCLVDIGAAGLLNGQNGVHYTLEDSEVDTGRRYDSRISGIDIDNLGEEKEAVEEALEDLRGSLVIRSYPAGTASVMTLRNHYNSMVMRGMRPDFVIVDYAELLKPSSGGDQKRFGIESIFRELVAWAQEINIPIWTAAQVNRDGLDVEVVTHKHLHECFAIAQIVHFFITINRKKDSPNPDIGNMFVVKNKIGKDGIKFPMLINTARSKIEILSQDAILDDDGDVDDLSSLREKFKAFKSKMSTRAVN